MTQTHAAPTHSMCLLPGMTTPVFKEHPVLLPTPPRFQYVGPRRRRRRTPAAGDSMLDHGDDDEDGVGGGGEEMDDDVSEDKQEGGGGSGSEGLGEMSAGARERYEKILVYSPRPRAEWYKTFPSSSNEEEDSQGWVSRGEQEAEDDEPSEQDPVATDPLTPTPHARRTSPPFVFTTPIASLDSSAGRAATSATPAANAAVAFARSQTAPYTGGWLSSGAETRTPIFSAPAVSGATPGTDTASPLYGLSTSSAADSLQGVGAIGGGGDGCSAHATPGRGNDLAAFIFRCIGSPGSVGSKGQGDAWSGTQGIGGSALAAVTAVADKLWHQCHAVRATPPPPPHPSVPPAVVSAPSSPPSTNSGVSHCAPGGLASIGQRVSHVHLDPLALWSRLECVRIHLLLHLSGDRSWATAELAKLNPLGGRDDGDGEGSGGVDGHGGAGEGGGEKIVLRGMLSLAHLLARSGDGTEKATGISINQ